MRSIVKAIITTSLLVLASSYSTKAQLVDPVRWFFSVEQVNDSVFDLRFEAEIESTWHLYALDNPNGPIPISFSFEPSDHYILKDSIRELNTPVEEHDPMFEAIVKYFSTEASYSQQIQLLTKDAQVITGTIDYQVCDDQVCSMLSTDFELSVVPPGSTGLEVNETASAEQSNVSAEPTVNLSTKSLMGLFLIAFLAGLIALLTPCVFPMIPMTVTFFMHGQKSRKRSLMEALFFGISIIAIYTIIGTLVAIIFGPGIANFLSTHWIPNVFFFLIFMFFAAWFFGMFEINLPSWMISKSDERVDKGGIGGPFFMAFTLVLVSFSCTGPIVGTILVQSAGGAVIEPIIGMLGFSLAFALPFTLFAIFPSWLKSMPKSGGWLNSVKVVLGFLELALGLKFLSIADQTYHWGLLDREVFLAFWIVIFTLMGFYILGKIKFKHDNEISHIGVPRLILAIITFAFVVYLIPGMVGAPLKALSGYMPPMSSHDFDIHRLIREESGSLTPAASYHNGLEAPCDKPKYGDQLHLPFGLEGYFDYEQGLDCAKKLNKPVFIDFTGHGCVNCREMEARVWSDPRVLKRLREDYVIIALYVDDKKIHLPESEWVTSTYDGKVKKTLGKKNQDFQISRFNQNTQPLYALLNPDGELLVPTRSYNLDIEDFIDFLDSGLEAYQESQERPSWLIEQ